MDFCHSRTDIPIVLLYNLNPAWSRQDIQECHAAASKLTDSLVEIGHRVQKVSVQSAELETFLEGYSADEHIIFNWCEELPGIPRSEYQVSQTLERMGFTFTGARSQTLALGQDKPRVKRLLHKKQIPIPRWQIYSSTDRISWTRFPAIVKLAFEHCSFGITRESVVQSTSELVKRVRFVVDEMHQPALVEEFIDGREFHVGVFGNDNLRVLPPAEIDYSAFEDIHDRLCTYESNYDPSSLAYQLTLPKLPAVLTKDQVSKLDEIVIAAYRAIGCRDYARMDVRLRDGIFYLLDVNPNPDISADTSFVLGAEFDGLPYGKLGSLLINLAAQRHPRFSSIHQPEEAGETICQEL
jgi:D-alanine-D-alanine ligase